MKNNMMTFEVGRVWKMDGLFYRKKKGRIPALNMV